MKIVLGILTLFAICFALAQGPAEFKKPAAKATKPTSNSVVTNVEVRLVLDKAWKVMAEALKLNSPSPVKLEPTSQPATKDSILAEFENIRKSASAHFKRSPRSSKFDPIRLRKDGDSATISSLVSKGLVMPLGPLVTGKNGPVSTYEFGDAVGVLINRISDLCHLPNAKYTPALMGG